MTKGELFWRIIAGAICLIIASTTEARPQYVDCMDSLECGLDSCCVLGPGRFSIPRCVSLRGVDESCRPGSQIPLNANVSYPDGERVDLTNIYSIMCPCQPGLFCSEQTATCQDSSTSIILNTIN